MGAQLISVSNFLRRLSSGTLVEIRLVKKDISTPLLKKKRDYNLIINRLYSKNQYFTMQRSCKATSYRKRKKLKIFNSFHGKEARSFLLLKCLFLH